MYDPVARRGSTLDLAASQPLGDTTPDEWVAETIALDDGCTASEPITVDGATGLIGADGCTRAAVTTDGRGYFFWLYTGRRRSFARRHLRPGVVRGVLATVQLRRSGRRR